MKSSVYKILVALTFILPTSTYLLISALFFNITPDVIVYDVLPHELIVSPYDNEKSLLSGTQEFKGHVITMNDVTYILVDDDDIIKVGFKYFLVQDGVLTERKLVEEQKSYKLPLAFFISVLSVAVAALVISKKMQVYKTRPRLATWITLFTITIALVIIDAIVSNMVGVFVMVLISFTLYCIEYLVQNGNVSSKDANKAQSDLIEQLKKAVNEL